MGMSQSEVVVNKNLEIKILQPAFVARRSPEAEGVFTGKSR